MDILGFLVTIVVVTASGALAPGPLFFANVAHGTRSGARGGIAFSIGHTIAEFSLVMLLTLGVFTVINEPAVKFVIGVVGGAFLLVFGLLQIRQLSTSKSEEFGGEGVPSRNPLLLGLIFTGLNPYFVIWWLTVGLKLISNSLIFASFAGVLLMYVAHVWMDYVWLTTTAFLARRGTSLIGSRGYRIVMAAFSLVIISFGLYFLLTSLEETGRFSFYKIS
jgi:threonine/homoserine/homoserine lactone efflux protein